MLVQTGHDLHILEGWLENVQVSGTSRTLYGG